MAKYLLVYGGGSMPETEEAQAQVMAAWDAWFHGMNGAVADPGNPTGEGRTVRADGSGLRGVAAGTDPAWSPDGARISFNLPNLSTVDGSRDPIVIANADGSDVRRTGAFGVAGAWNPAPAS